ncbi:hypothetical protein KVT40_005627 [Elsinoe batatas]|uniref:Uncharacterized protein n=1 Tax=Elsinoe batatas TaxID=2601811 RepID=A0A8K0L059_9PEZI|nr:hypothetical protein KVT40_005627 [Elsinoe batatas]
MPFLTAETNGGRGAGDTSLDANVPQLPLGTQLKPGELLVKLIAIGSDAADQSAHPANVRDFIGTVIAEGPLPAGHAKSYETLTRDINGTKEQESVSATRSASYTLVSRERVPILKRTSSGRYAPNWGTPTWTQSLYGQSKEEDTGSVIIGETPEERSLDSGKSTFALVERNGAPVFRRTASGRHAPNWGTPTWSTGNKFDESIARLNGSRSINGDEASREDILVRRTRPSIMKRVSSGRHAPQWNAPAFATRSVTSPAVVGTSVPVEESTDVPNTSLNLTPRGRPGSFKRVSSGRHAPQWGSPSFDKPVLSQTPVSHINGDAPSTILKRKASDDDRAYKLVQRSGSPVFKRVSSGRTVPQWSSGIFAQAETREEEAQFTYRLVEREDGTSVFRKVPLGSSGPDTATLGDSPQATPNRPKNRKRISSGRHAPQWGGPAFTQTSTVAEPTLEQFPYRLVDRPDGTSIFKKVTLTASSSTPDSNLPTSPTSPSQNNIPSPTKRTSSAPILKRTSSGRHAPQWSSPLFSPGPTHPAQQVGMSGSASATNLPDQKFTYRMLEREDGTPVFKRVSFYLPGETATTVTSDPGMAVQEAENGWKGATRPGPTPQQPLLRNGKVRKGQAQAEEEEKQVSLVGRVVFGSFGGAVQSGYITVQKGEVAGSWTPIARSGGGAVRGG